MINISFISSIMKFFSTFELTIITNIIIYCTVVLFPLQTQS